VILKGGNCNLVNVLLKGQTALYIDQCFRSWALLRSSYIWLTAEVFKHEKFTT
jgi:hypothetical protein